MVFTSAMIVDITLFLSCLSITALCLAVSAITSSAVVICYGRLLYRTGNFSTADGCSSSLLESIILLTTYCGESRSLHVRRTLGRPCFPGSPTASYCHTKSDPTKSSSWQVQSLLDKSLYSSFGAGGLFSVQSSP